MQPQTPALTPKKILQNIGIKKGMKVGDFGCGRRGTFAFASADLVGVDGVVYVVDILKPVLKSIGDQAFLEGYENIKTFWSNLEKYGATRIDDNSLDFGLLINVLFQTEYPNAVINESMRMIKKGGLLFVADWLTDSYINKTDLKNLRKAEEVKIIAKDLGLELVKEYNLWSSHFGLLFRK